MRCYICDKKLEAQEITLDKENKFRPCTECLEVAWDINKDEGEADELIPYNDDIHNFDPSKVFDL